MVVEDKYLHRKPEAVLLVPKCLRFSETQQHMKESYRQPAEFKWSHVQAICQSSLCELTPLIQSLTLSQRMAGLHLVITVTIQDKSYMLNIFSNGNWYIEYPGVNDVDNLWKCEGDNTHEDATPKCINALWVCKTGAEFEARLKQEFPNETWRQVLLALLFMGNVVLLKQRRKQIIFE